VRADGLQRARNDPFRLLPPRRREGVFLCTPVRMIVIPVTHDLIHLTAVDASDLPLSLLDEVPEERGTRRERRVVDVAIERLVHSKHEPGHIVSFSVCTGGPPGHPDGRPGRCRSCDLTRE